MRVFTHFEYIDSFSETSKGKIQNGIRWRTLLQYGSSWDIIGSVVMMNPGSANFKNNNPIQGELLNHLKSFENGLTGYDWFEFREDNAMINVGKMFALRYGMKDRHNLNGIVQIFNLFYIKEPKLELAKVLDRKITYQIPGLSVDYDLDCLLYHNNKRINVPIYLGFGSLAHDEYYRPTAEMFFNKTISTSKYLDPDFSKNKFYYPTYIIGQGKNRMTSKMALSRFLLNKQDISESDVEFLKLHFNIDITTDISPQLQCTSTNGELVEQLIEFLKHQECLGCDSCFEKFRFKINNFLSVSIRKEGIVSYRPIKFNDYWKDHKYVQDNRIDSVIDYFRSQPDCDSIKFPQTVWLVEKNFVCYGQSFDEISGNLLKEIKELKVL